ncbi:Rrf2 family transcriptional regulator [Afifella sp. H1R]|uniref:Rrf2 family transcriptional regulator n=1 Tax=Afifella sp. H1R TaxID=2908841 RepID=UPI001F40A68E|nr:Rrf2 family transcriptional regulator [Afifella sp. H1R]MCF1503283.1 Rrf2 family transcriptional regulator [Afifella sp. H1R]
MILDSRLSSVLHVLLHMAEHEGPVTSEVLAKAMSTNPVVVRRVMAGLREQGYVRSTKGHRGGWELARRLEEISLRDVYEALGRPSFFAMGNRNNESTCLVERAVNAALDQTLSEAEALILTRLDTVTLAMLSAEFHAGLPKDKRDAEVCHAV